MTEQPMALSTQTVVSEKTVVPTVTKTVFVKTYGCQMNVYDSERMTDVLADVGYRMVEAPHDADMIIINTCHIREKATEKLFSELGRLKTHKKRRLRQGQNTLIAVAGCVAQAEGADILKRAPFVDFILGPQNYHELPTMIQELQTLRDAADALGDGPLLPTRYREAEQRSVIRTEFPIESKFDFLPTNAANPALTKFIAVQEGCDKFCSFCVVPYTRGAEFSRPARQILDEVRAVVEAGTREITLLGQNVNAYHGEGPGGITWSLADLLSGLANINGLDRLRYTTSHPRDMTHDLIQAHRDLPILMPYLHLPVQSGSDAVLERMNRKYTLEAYAEIIEALRKARPDIALSSDFIVGFPGETDADFQATLDAVMRIGFAQSYSFKYSVRPGTPAGDAEDQIPESVKDERLQTLQQHLFAQQKHFNQQCVGKILPVLFDHEGRHAGQWIGRSPYLQSVHVHADTSLLGKILPVHILDGHLNSLSGILLSLS